MLSQPHPLAAIDHAFVGHTVTGVLRYAGRLDAERLADSLTQVLEGLPLLACGLGVLEEARYGFVPLASTPRWLETDEVPRLPDVLEDPRVLERLVPRLVPGPGQPLLRARLVCAPEDSLLCVTVSHALVDGYAFFAFLRAWSRRMLGRPGEPPPWDRRLLDVEPPASAAPLAPEDVWRRTGFSWCPDRPRALDTPRPASFGRRVVPPEPRPLAEGQSLSDNDIVCAWLIKTYGGGLAGPEGLALAFPVDYRRSFGALPTGYLGNAVRFAPLWLPRDILERESIPQLAARVQEAVRGVLDEHSARESLECLEQLRREQGLGSSDALHAVEPRTGFLITNVSRLPFGMLDFGLGPPVRALLPVVGERTAAIQQADEGYEVSLMLPPE